MKELETSLQQFGEFLLKARLVRENTAPHCVRWVRRFLVRPASNEPLADRARRFSEDLERGGCQDWQVRQAEQAVRIYFVNFLRRSDWHRQPASAVVDEQQRADPLAVLEELRRRLRTRHYSYRTECSYADWVRRFLAYLSERQGVPNPRIESGMVRDYLAHLAVRQRVSASTQNQAFCSILFLCREVLGMEVEEVSGIARAKRGDRLPVVLTVPETAALLAAMRGTTWPRRAETSCGPNCADQRHCTEPIGRRGWPACGCPTRWNASTRTPVASWAGSGCFPVRRYRPTRAPPSCAATTFTSRSSRRPSKRRRSGHGSTSLFQSTC